MNSRHHIGIFLATIGLALLAGCASQKPKAAVLEPTARQTGESSSTSAAAAPGFNQPEALARKTAEYTQLLGLEPRKTPPASATQSTAKAELPSDVKCVEPFDIGVNSATISQQRTLEPRRLDERARSAAVAIDSSPGTANAAPGVDKTITGANSPAIVQPQSTEALAPSTPIGSSAELSQKLEKRVKEYPRDISAHLDYQLLRFLLDDRVPDLAALSTLPTEDRELVSSLIDGLINFRSSVRQDNNMLLSRKVRPLLEMADRLRGQADLTIPAIALCRSVRTFGEYDPIEPARFAAGKVNDVILYCEVANFSSQLDDKQMWQTKLMQEAMLYTENGIQVWSDKSEPINDVARHRRHDFFTVKKLRIPSSLAVGRYLMKVTIVDQQMNRVAEATVPIIIAVE